MTGNSTPSEAEPKTEFRLQLPTLSNAIAMVSGLVLSGAGFVVGSWFERNPELGRTVIAQLFSIVSNHLTK